MKRIKSGILGACLALLICVQSFGQTSYEWVGVKDSKWEVATNWKPKGVPGPSDDVAIGKNGVNPELESPQSIRSLSISHKILIMSGGGSLDLTGTLDCSYGGIIGGAVTLNSSKTKDYFRSIEFTFESTLSATSPSILCVNSEFNDAAFDMTGTTKDLSGGNKFNGNTEIRNSSSKSDMYWGFKSADRAKGRVTVQADYAGIVLGYSSQMLLEGDLIIKDGNGKVSVGIKGNGDGVMFTGDREQLFGRSDNALIAVNGMEVNKPEDVVTLDGRITVQGSMKFSEGVIVAENGSFIEFEEDATVSDSGTKSYVDGPVLKHGSSDFLFPIGDGNIYRPITMTQLSASGVFGAEYHDINSDQLYPHSNKDGTIPALSTAGYWDWTGDETTDLKVELPYDLIHSCGIRSTNELGVAMWSGTNWKDLNGSHFSGDTESGSVVATMSAGDSGPVTLVVSEEPALVIDAGPDATPLFSVPVELGGNPTANQGSEPYDYEWESSSGTLLSNQPNPSLAFAANDSVTVIASDSRGCKGRDHALVTVVPSLEIDINALNSVLGGEVSGELLKGGSHVANFSDEGLVSLNYGLTGDPEKEDDMQIELNTDSLSDIRLFFTLNGVGSISGLSIELMDSLTGQPADTVQLNGFFYESEPGSLSLHMGRGKPDRESDVISLGLYDGVLVTPNDDGQYDVFSAEVKYQSTYNLTILDTETSVLFNTNYPSDHWDCKVDGQLVDPGPYVFRFDIDGEQFEGQFLIEY